MKPSAPPAPPRRHSSGIRPPEEQQPPTQNYGEPPTMAAARARIHEIARELPAENRFAHDHQARHNFNDETQGRIEPIDFAAAHQAYDRQFGAPADAYDQLPALGHHEHFDANLPYQQQDPMTELRPAYDEALQRHEQRHESRNDGFRSDRPLPEDDSSGEYARGGRKHGSFAPEGNERRSPPPPATYSAASNSYDPAAYEANYPKSPRQEPSYADRRDAVSSAPRSDRRERERERERERDDGRSFRRDDFPRESSYRDEPRRDSDRDRRDEGRSFRREEPARREASSYQPARADETRAEGSSEKHEAKRGEGSWRERDRDRNEPSIPGPAAVPRELRVPENFVVGVQPIRTPNTPSMGAPYPQPQAVIAPSYPPAMTAAASPGAMNMNMPMGPMTANPSLGQMGMPIIPQISMPPMMAPMAPMTAGMHVRAHTSARPPGHVPQMTEVEEAAQGSKVGRFAWFVFGAAFGIFFAFAATGFGFGGKKDEPAPFPLPPTQLVQQPPVQAQQPAPVPVAPPVVQQQQPAPLAPQAMQPAPGQPLPPQQPGLAPAVAQVPAPPPGVMVAPNQNVGPIVPAPGGPQAQNQAPSQGPQGQPPLQAGGRGPSAGANQGTVVVRGGGGGARGGARRGGGGGGGARPAAPQNASNNDGDDAPAPKKSGGGEPNIADLLGDGLGK